MRAEDLVSKLIESDPDDLRAKDYVLSTNPWWKSQDAFTKAYIVAALWTSTGAPYGECPCCGREAVLDSLPEDEFEQTPMCSAEGCGVKLDENPPNLDANYSVDDIDHDTLRQMVEDCARFQTENAADIATYSEYRATGEYTGDEMAGHDFWLTRNGTGAGFFDRTNVPEDVRDRLEEAARAYRSVDLYVGDDGKIYQA